MLQLVAYIACGYTSQVTHVPFAHLRQFKCCLTPEFSDFIFKNKITNRAEHDHLTALSCCAISPPFYTSPFCRSRSDMTSLMPPKNVLFYLVIWHFAVRTKAQIKDCFYYDGRPSPDFPCDPEAEVCSSYS